MTLANQIQITAQIVAIIGGLIAAYKIITEIKQSRLERHRDLRWKQANSAHGFLKDMLASQMVTDATIMLDWTGRTFNITPDQKATITFQDVQVGLRTDNLNFTEKEVYIRDCADAFLFHVELIEQAIRNDLIEFRDIKFPMTYYVNAMRKNNLYNAYLAFIKEYEYKNAEKFLNRFSAKLKTSRVMS